MITIDQRSNTPLYEQIYMQIIKMIALNVYTYNDKIPSIRELAVDIKVNPNTIQRAYQNLEQDGIIFSLKGKGFFVNVDNNLKDVLVKNDRTKLFKHLKYLQDIGFNKKEIQDLVNEILQKMEEENAGN